MGRPQAEHEKARPQEDKARCHEEHADDEPPLPAPASCPLEGRQGPEELTEGRRWLEVFALGLGAGWIEVLMREDVTEVLMGEDGACIHEDWAAQGCSPGEREDLEELMCEVLWVHVKLCEVRWIHVLARCWPPCCAWKLLGRCSACCQEASALAR